MTTEHQPTDNFASHRPSAARPTVATVAIETPVHALPWWPQGPRQPRPALRTVVRSGAGVAVQEPFGRILPWPGGADLGLRVGQVVWAVWTDMLLAGTIPGTTVLCTDPECALALYRCHEDGRHQPDRRIEGPHFAVFDGVALPGVDVP